ncbi:MAG: YncE family protein [Thaumarchaeota archaeon]|nr:YncE family protein [Nitrososphaerota archaeon]
MKFYPLAIILLLAPMPILLSNSTNGADAQPSWSSVSLGTVPRGLALDSSTGTIYAVMYLNGTAFAIDLHSLKVVARIPIPFPDAIAVNTATDRVYVSRGVGAVAVVDGFSHSVVSEIQTGDDYALAVDEMRDLVFAADTGDNMLWVINGSIDAVAARVPMGDTSALAVDPSVGEAFIGNLSSDLTSGTVDVVNESAFHAAVRTVQVPFPPMHFSVDPALHLLFVTSGSAASGANPNFLAIDDRTLQVAYAVNIGNASPGITAVSPSHGVYVSDAGNGRIYELDEKTGQLLQNFSASDGGSSTGEVTAMALSSSNGKLYLTETDDPELLILTPPQAAPSSGVPLTYAYFVVLVLVAGAAVSFAAVRRRRGPRQAR